MDIVFSFRDSGYEIRDSGYEIRGTRFEFEIHYFLQFVVFSKSQRDDLAKDRMKSYQQKYSVFKISVRIGLKHQFLKVTM